MALLNKLFFPSTTPTVSSATAAVSTVTAASSLSSTISSNPTTVTTPAANSSLASLAASWTNATSTIPKRQSSNHQAVHSKNYISQFPFDGRQVRLLLYRECDNRGRRLLFDSNALQRVPLKDGNTEKSELKETSSTFANKHKLQPNKTSTTSFIEINKDYGFKHNRPTTTDIGATGEMIFGALAMSFRGTALKVHWLKDPARILCSEVFFIPHGSAQNGHSPYSTMSTNSLATPRTSISSEHGSFDGISMSSLSIPFSISVSKSSQYTSPLDVPDQQSLSLNSDSGRSSSSAPRYSLTLSNATDSGFSSGLSSRSTGGGCSSDQWSAYQYSTRSSIGSVTSEQSEHYRKLSVDFFPTSSSSWSNEITSDNCLQRRISRNLRTSFENEHSVNDFIGFVSDNNYPYGGNQNVGGSEGSAMTVPYRRASYCANESRSNPEIGKKRDVALIKSMARRPKLGLAVCITMSESFEEEMELFCSEHIALLESMLSRIRASTERAYINHKNFLQIMVHAWLETQKWFNDLFTAPRIKCPVWISITTSGSKYSKNVADRFIKELCWLLSFADTKDTNFFISTMLTAILTHHLGWVSTVSGFKSSSSEGHEKAAAALERRAKLLQISQKHPYNALWAQMGDLFGAIGLPPKLARTVVYGAEKLPVEKLLNVLTYFIRCGEVRRSSKKEDFNKEVLFSLIDQSRNETFKKTLHKSSNGVKKSLIGCGGMTRTKSCKTNLSALYDANEESSSSGDSSDEMDPVNIEKKNEIPNVLAFRDSRFVQQELRIGNYLMDTGIERSDILRIQNERKLQQENKKELPIKLTITTPDNVNFPLEDESGSGSITSSVDGAVEAIEIDSLENDSLETNSSKLGKRNIFWNTIKDGFSLTDLDKLKNGVKIFSRKLNDHQLKQNLQTDSVKSTLSLSDLITQNSMGIGDRMNWGIEPIKENVSLEEQIHFDLYTKLIEREHGVYRRKENGKDVVFVLGDNEPLVNIKKSTEDLTYLPSTNQLQNSTISLVSNSSQSSLCPLHQNSFNSIYLKKSNGVKFNFEQFPENTKNLVLSNYDLLMDKCAKIEETEMMRNDETIASSSSKSSTTTITTTTSCIMCNNLSMPLRTPSNVTELDYDTDEVHGFQNTALIEKKTIPTVESSTSIDTLKSTSNILEKSLNESPVTMRKQTFNSNNKKVPSHRSSISSVAAKCAAVNESAHLLKLPLPGIKELPQEPEPPGDMKLRAGFLPSLFLSVNDHYVADMVLQGTNAPPRSWEINLREDLALAAHSASLISMPAENLAIVADMEKWDVRLISSQAQSFPYAGGQSSPVGMSQLVASMLEAVQAMYNSGISAYECLSFLECKLQEIYLHSETLAAFLLETDFCSLSAVTTALHISENDVPLLLSIASIHSPQISKKCGISFR